MKSAGVEDLDSLRIRFESFEAREKHENSRKKTLRQIYNIQVGVVAEIYRVFE